MRKLIYIMGCAHCGSTLLTTLLGRHPEIATVGELKMSAIPDVGNYLCGCGEQLLDCDFWRRVHIECGRAGDGFDFDDIGTHFWGSGGLIGRILGSRVRGSGFELMRRAATRISPGAERSFERITKRNLELVAAICRVSGKRVFLDGSKDPVRLLHFSRSPELDVRGIHLLRDGRAILASHKKRKPDMRANLREWREKTVECELTKRAVGTGCVLTVRYEDLCENPRGILSRIFEFAGLPDESERCMVPGEGDSIHIIGHNSRLGQHREIRLKRDWEQLLTPEDLAMFVNSDRGLNACYGYA